MHVSFPCHPPPARERRVLRLQTGLAGHVPSWVGQATAAAGDIRLRVILATRARRSGPSSDPAPRDRSHPTHGGGRTCRRSANRNRGPRLGQRTRASRRRSWGWSGTSKFRGPGSMSGRAASPSGCRRSATTPGRGSCRQRRRTGSGRLLIPRRGAITACERSDVPYWSRVKAKGCRFRAKQKRRPGRSRLDSRPQLACSPTGVTRGRKANKLQRP